MKLHLGCGEKKWGGFVNCDLKDSNVDCDIRTLPFEDESADEIHAIHVCEHFYFHEVGNVFREWRRVLKPNGRLFIELPCWDKIKQGIADGIIDEAVKCALYGDPLTHHDGEPSLHKWAWSIDGMAAVLKQAGFQKVISMEPLFHVKTRDMRLEAIK